MSDSSEKLGLKLLQALKRETTLGKSLLDCRPISAVAAELGFSDSEGEQAVKFLIARQAINAVHRRDGMAALPSPEGDALLAAKQEKTAWTFDRRLMLYPIVITLDLAAIGLSRCTQK